MMTTWNQKKDGKFFPGKSLFEIQTSGLKLGSQTYRPPKFTLLGTNSELTSENGCMVGSDEISSWDDLF